MASPPAEPGGGVICGANLLVAGHVALAPAAARLRGSAASAAAFVEDVLLWDEQSEHCDVRLPNNTYSPAVRERERESAIERERYNMCMCLPMLGAVGVGVHVWACVRGHVRVCVCRRVCVSIRH